MCRHAKYVLSAGVLVNILLSVQASAQDVPVVDTNTRAAQQPATHSSNPTVRTVQGMLPEQLPVPRSFEIPPQQEGPFGPLQGKVVEPLLEVIEFRGLTVNEALRLFSEQTGIRVIASEKAGGKQISAYLRDVSPLGALGAIVRANGLFMRCDPDSKILTVYTQEEYDADMTSFREEQTKVFTLLYPNAYDVGIAIRDLYGEKVLLSFGDNDGTLMTDLVSRFARFSILNSQSQGGIVGGGLGGGLGGIGGGIGGGLGGIGGGIGGIGGGLGGGLGGIGGGLGGGIGGGIGGGLGGIGGGIGGGLGGGFGGIGGGLGGGFGGQGGGQSQPGPSTEGITIFVTVVRKNNQVVVRTSDPKTMAQICDLVVHLDVATPLVLLEVKILSVDLKDDFKSAFDWQFSDPFWAGSFTGGNIIAPAADFNIPDPAQKRINSIALGGAGFDPTALLFQYVSASFRFRMQLLESKNRLTEVASPMVLTANNEVSRMFIGVNTPITLGFTPGQTVTTGVATASTVQATPITQIVPVGTQLIITPNINADRTVTLRVAQQTSSVIPDGGKIPLPNPDGGVTEVSVDVVATRTFTGTIVAKDGHAVAIGGLIEEYVKDARGEVPVLGRVPYLGFFFRRQVTERGRREQIIVIRPYVFYTPVESAALTHDLLRNLSSHPLSPNAAGNMDSFAPQETLFPNPPRTPLERIFQVHMITPKDF